MCGRLACGLEPEQVCNSCCYKTPDGSAFVRPQWKHVTNSGKTYKSSYNICPSEVAPVLLSGSHFNSNSRVIAPMVFGLIPSWGMRNKFSTINCRIETIQTKKTFGVPLQKGQRCVVICSGFYEWQKKSQSKKQPYFIHHQQPDSIQVDDPNTWNVTLMREEGWQGFKTLKMAALFEKQVDSLTEFGEGKTLSFTIITKEASTEMTWLHHRMPALIETEEQLDVWLNHDKYDANQALEWLRRGEKISITWIPVSNSVNITTTKDISCIKQQQQPEEKPKDSKKRESSKMLLNWLERGKAKDTNGGDSSPEKKRKKDE